MAKLVALLPVVWAITVAVIRLAELWTMMREARDWRNRPSSATPNQPVPTEVAPGETGTNRLHSRGLLKAASAPFKR